MALIMIKSWANRASERLFLEGKTRGFGGLDAQFALELLAVLDAATALSDLSSLKSIGLHKLKGDRAGQWAMTVNARWRICFRFKGGDAFAVEVVDYHRG